MEKFADLMVKDLKTGTCYRADKYLAEYMKNLLAKKKKLTPEQIKEYTEIMVALQA